MDIQSPLPKRRPLHKIGMTGVVCACLFSLLLGVQWAFADATRLVAPKTVDVAPDAPGSIVGMVTNANGKPLTGIKIVVSQGADLNWQPSRSLITDDTGAYKAGALGAGVYQVKFYDPNQYYAFQFYPGLNTIDEATDIIVTGNQVTGIDAVMLPAGYLTGTIAGYPINTPNLQSVALYARTATNEWSLAEWLNYEKSLRDQTVAYRFVGLPAGIYHVCVGANFDFSGDDASECYDDVLRTGNFANATDITITAGITTGQINFLLGEPPDDYPELAKISGTVSTSDGLPVEGIEVKAFLYYNGNWQGEGAVTHSDSLGRYHLWLQPATYILSKVDPQSRYAPEFHFHARTPQDAVKFEVKAGDRLTTLNLILTPASHITGVVTLAGEVTGANGWVYAYQKAGAIWKNISYSPIDPTTGQYDIGGLLSGAFRIKAELYAGATDYGHLIGFYGDATALDDATDVIVGESQTAANINFDLGQGQFESVITGSVTAEGKPQSGIQVEVYTNNEIPVRIVYTTTNRSGQYQLSALFNGRYHLRFYDPTHTFAPIHYNNARLWTEATPIVVQGSALISNVNASLVRAGAIHGQVRRGDGMPLHNILVSVNRHDPPPGETDGTGFGVLTATDEQGYYQLVDLAPGYYRLWFQDLTTGITEYYGSATDLAQANDILVESGIVITGIDMVLGPDVLIYAPLLMQ